MIISLDRNGLLSLSLGTGFLLASNVMGHGVCIKPDPRAALLLAASGLLFLVLAEHRSERWRETFLRVLQVVLAMGAFSVVAAFVVRDLQEFHQMASQDWGAIPPPQLMFATTYTLASLVTLLGLSVNARRRRSAPVAAE
jgi:NADH:ubiquinone oxidoreductase subunit 6 (subunit J)